MSKDKQPPKGPQNTSDPAFLPDYTDQQLIDELLKRFDYIVIAGDKILVTPAGKNPGESRRTLFWYGDDTYCCGLANDAAFDIQLHRAHNYEPPDKNTPNTGDWDK